MASPVDICNLALSLLGEEAEVTSIEPVEGSDEANHCARWYPIALKRMLETGDWSFAMRKAALTQYSSKIDPGEYGWKFAYSLPSKFMRAVGITTDRDLEHGRPAKYYDFELLTAGNNQSRLLLCNLPSCVLTYIAYVDTAALFPGYFVDALAILLASYLYGPIHRSDYSSQQASTLLEKYEAALSRAKTLDAQTSAQRDYRHHAAQLRVRRV